MSGNLNGPVLHGHHAQKHLVAEEVVLFNVRGTRGLVEVVVGAGKPAAVAVQKALGALRVTVERWKTQVFNKFDMNFHN